MAKRRKFKNEDKEREFWSEQDSTKLVEWCMLLWRTTPVYQTH